MTGATTQKVRRAIAQQCGIQAAVMRAASAFRILPTISFAAGGRSVRWTIVDCGWNGGGDALQLRGRKPGSIFNPVTSQFVQCQNMVDLRWYATTTELANGRIMAMSGL